MTPELEGIVASAQEGAAGGESSEDRATELIRMASHDLRSPLTAIQFFVERLEHHGRKGLDPSAVQWADGLSGISRAARHALRLIDDLLNTERVQTHAAAVVGTPATVDVEEVIAEAMIVQREALERADCDVTVMRKPGLERACGRWNRACLLRIFSNLLHNASKYAPHAPVHVQLARAHDRLRIVVADRGPGMPNGPGAETGKYLDDGAAPTGAHGLGLWIVRRGVAQLDGTMKVRNAPGFGLAFIIELPGLQL
jgi:signal transduction histidine kinase